MMTTQDLGPKQKRDLTTREKIILMQGSRLNGHIFPPWTSPKSSDFEMPQYEDNGLLSLSSVQLDVFDGWRRPTVVARTSHNNNDTTPTMIAKKPIDLVQDITTDCSVVASLCAASARLVTGRPDVILRNVFPRDSNLPQPVVSPNGKYIIRLYFNGCSRKVIIDDRLPASRTTRALHVVDRSNPGMLWPALIEKAYLKVRGGYDFPGSNSGTDLWVLTGWIPEQLFIQSDDVVRNALWRRIYAAFNYGDVLVTMGTGKLTPSEEEGMGLGGEHDYAVMDLKECEGQQLLLVKNPWSEGTIWKGHIFPNKATSEMVKTSERYDVTSTVSSSRKHHCSLGPGTFWMALDDVFQSFDSIYLNWNPRLFSYKEDVHFDWDLSECISPQGSFVPNPQYVVESKAGGTLWLLLCRHFTSKDQAFGEERKAHMSEEDEPGFISLYAFDNAGERVVCSDGAIHQSLYVDSPNSLLKLELPAGRAFTVVISEQSLPRIRNVFTLTVFSLMSFKFLEARDRFAHSISQEGAWTALTAGGNASGSTYDINPQFSLGLRDTSDLSILLESTTRCLPIHVKLLWAKGKQVRSVTSRDVVGDSGEYRKGFAFATIRSVQAGVYTLVCSTFEHGQLGNFTLYVKSMLPCTIERIATTAAGRFITKARLSRFTPGRQRLVALLVSQRLNRVSIIARSCGDRSEFNRSAYSPLKVLLEHGQGPSNRVLGTSGEDEFIDGQARIHCPEVDVQPSMCAEGGVWLVIERLACSGLQSDEFVDVELFSEEPIEIHNWSDGD